MLPNFGTDGLSCPGGAAPTACPAGRVLCNGACFPEGACQPADCAPGWGYCYGVCRDLQTDPGACGACGTACPGGICLDGTCLICPEGHMACGGACVNVQGDLEHCGFCNNRCGTQCIDGQCTGTGPAPTVTCPAGQTRCGEACVDTTTNSTNCGACGVVCNPDKACRPPGVCSHSDAYCRTKNSRWCDSVGGCVIYTHTDHCGGCDLACPGGLACSGEDGICYTIGDSILNGVKPIPQQTLAAADPPADAAPAESPDPQTLAPADATTCAPGLVDCSGVCVDVASDPVNCGICGVTCGADPCIGGFCTPPADVAPPIEEAPLASDCASQGLTDCGGICVDLSFDSLNCGSCGVVCGSGLSCDLGVCGGNLAPPPPPETEIDIVEEGSACLPTGEVCDPALPNVCCSGTCSGDGTCA